MLIYCDTYITYLYNCITVIEDNCVIYTRKEKSSEILKWILGLLKSLICREDKENSHTTIYQRRKLSALYSTAIIKSKNNLKISDLNKAYKSKLSFETIHNLSSGKCNKKRPSCPFYIGLVQLDEVVFMSDWSSCSSLQPYKSMNLITQ